MQRYAPEWKDLAPRDIVARSIQWEMMSQGAPNVFLDLRSYIPTTEILSHFPTIYEYCLRYGVDLTQDLVPVVPAAHYACGGVKVDQWGRTTLERLYAVGEVACTGLHGANRLASTSLLEGLVWGYQAAAHIQEHWHKEAELGTPEVKAYEPAASGAVEQAQIDQTSELVQSLMWEHVGLVRSTAGLEYALHELGRIAAEVEACYRRSQPTDQLAGLRNMARVALLICEAALRNGVSQGCHYRLSAAEERRLFSWKVGLAEPALTGYNSRG
jgi:L-aspartate oxidase